MVLTYDFAHGLPLSTFKTPHNSKILNFTTGGL